jgi:hypothetical protein
LKSTLHFIGATDDQATRNHTVFVEDKHEADTFDPTEYFSTLPELVDRTHNRPRVEQLTSPEFVSPAIDNKVG